MMMTDEQMVAMQKIASDMRKKWTDKKCTAYAELIDLSELDNHNLCDEEEKNAEHALETTMKYGSFADGAKAIKLFGTYSTFKHLLEG